MITFETNKSVILGAQAWLVEDDRELAWAENHVIKNAALKYVLGKFVEADNANENGHVFPLKDLHDAQKTIPNSPLNWLHRPHYVVGNFVASELVYPTGEAADAGSPPERPFVEALAAFYRYYFPEEFKTIEAAHAEGSLFYSMECVPNTVTCLGVCGKEFAYDGRTSDTYCDHLNQPKAQKGLNQPHFTGGALIVPPVKPGWKKADITELNALLETHARECELAYNSVAGELTHLESRQWEAMMLQLARFCSAP